MKNSTKLSLIIGSLIGVSSFSSYALEASLYGLGHLSVDSINNGAETSTFTHSNSSLLGVKGQQKLNADLMAVFQYETGMDLTGRGTGDGNGPGPSGSTLFTRTRTSYVGLSGGFGTVIGGRLPTNNQWLYDFNLFADQVGDLGNIFGRNFTGRADGAVQYKTPSFGGVTVGLSYIPDQGIDQNSTSILKADYVAGGLKTGLAYINAASTAAAATVKEASALTGSYNFGLFTLGGAYQKESSVGNVSGQDVDKWTLGGSMKVGSNGSIKTQYTSAGKIGSTSGTDATQLAVGYDYDYDKSTTLYIAYAETKNSASATYSAYNWGHGDHGTGTANFAGPVADKTASAVSVGLMYKFDASIAR